MFYLRINILYHINPNPNPSLPWSLPCCTKLNSDRVTLKIVEIDYIKIK